MRWSLLLIAGLLTAWQGACTASCRSEQGNYLFCDDFDDAQLNEWDRLPEGESRALLVAPGPGGNPQDNRVLQFRLPPGRGGIGLNKTFDRGYDKLYSRWYVYYEAGFDFRAKNHGHGFHAGKRWKKGVAGNRPEGDDYFTVQLEHIIAPSIRKPVHYLYAYYRGMSMDCRDPRGKCWGDHFPCMLTWDGYCKPPVTREQDMGPVLETGKWYCVELMVDAGDAVQSREQANGEINFWVNGKSVGPWRGLWLRTDEQVKINHFWLGLFHHGKHSEAGMRFDNVAVDTQRIGFL